MKNKRYTLLDKSEIMTCWKCGGNKDVSCDICHGTNEFRESHYVIIDEKRKIAFDSDTGG
jgi:hypothetical protein